jgi:hypothetical protein
MLAEYAANAQAEQTEERLLEGAERTSVAISRASVRLIERNRSIAALNLTAEEQALYAATVERYKALLQA